MSTERREEEGRKERGEWREGGEMEEDGDSTRGEGSLTRPLHQPSLAWRITGSPFQTRTSLFVKGR